MNSKSLFKFLGVILLSMVVVFGSCKKDDDDPEPEPVAYVPSFSATSIGQGTDIIFGVTCVTDDFTYTKLVVTAPTSEQMTYAGTGAIVLRGEVVTVPDVFNRLSGTWTFTTTGTISGGTNAGVGFVASTTVNVSAK
ncbi:MAG: hypothetical protein QM503_04850 [Bacteroidota bacterium]